MKINPLPSWEYLNECFELDETCQSGLRWKERPVHHGEKILAFNRRWVNQEAGRIGYSGYSEIYIDGICYRAHRLLYCLFHKINIDNQLIDHKDRDIKNNKIDNLRIVTHQQNQWNAGIAKNNTSGYKNIKIRKLKGGRCSYIVSVMVDHKTHTLGSFRDLNMAIEAQTNFVKSMHGEFAVLNPPNIAHNEQDNDLMIHKEWPFEFAVY